MSINPIDIVTIAPKSQETSQMQSANQHKVQHMQEAQEVKFQKEVEHNTKQTVKTIKGENNEYRYDAKEKGNGTYEKKKKEQKKKQESSKEEKEKMKLSSFDITI